MSVTTQKMRKTILISKKEKRKNVFSTETTDFCPYRGDLQKKKKKKKGLQAGNPQLPAAGIEVGDCRFAKRH